MREKVSSIVFNVLREFNEIYEKQIPLQLGESIPLFGKEGQLDSLGLVSVVVSIEQALEDQMGVSIILADEKAMSQKTSPFRTAGSLIEYICNLLQEETPVCANPLH
jgi:D-alanine--poly(phosphoribitol) ligase subunit 2